VLHTPVIISTYAVDEENKLLSIFTSLTRHLNSILYQISPGSSFSTFTLFIFLLLLRFFFFIYDFLVLCRLISPFSIFFWDRSRSLISFVTYSFQIYGGLTLLKGPTGLHSSPSMSFHSANMSINLISIRAIFYQINVTADPHLKL
jgi:hypothetical protein